jgi:ubiquitin-conjugating enzyme E2 S
MQTKIFHPNVSKAGEICVDTLKKGWKKEYGVGHVLVVSLRDVLDLVVPTH